jgi:hypothetical protein
MLDEHAPPEDVYAARVQALRDQLTKLRTREAELRHQLAAAYASPADFGCCDQRFWGVAGASVLDGFVLVDCGLGGVGGWMP